MFAPMSLLTYDDARPYARSIKQRVVARIMPPWGADSGARRVQERPAAVAGEIDTIAAWVDGGAVKGNDAICRRRREFADGWTIGKPDAVFTMDEEYDIPATGVIPYQYLRVPTISPKTSGFRRLRSAGQRTRRCITCWRTRSRRASRQPGRGLGPTNIGGVTPNKPGITFEPGVARLLRGNSDLIMQMHYTTNGKPAKDRHAHRRRSMPSRPPTKLQARRHGAAAALRDSGLRRQRRE
jgi:hypothetical protein